jgi:hypothetical protein
MKIGIVTFYWSEENYGQILQCYALQKYLHDAGHDPYLIRYFPRNDRVPTPFLLRCLKGLNICKLIRFLLSIKASFLNRREKAKHPRFFDAFREKHLKQSGRVYHSYNELLTCPPDGDAYIVGSDQVWNFHFWGSHLNNVKNIMNAYLLNFGGDDKKRIAYAASFGKEKLEKEFNLEFSRLLHNFDYVSVREESGKDICCECGFRNSKLVPDPTLLLNVDNYRLLYKDVQVKLSKPYCVLYMLDISYNLNMRLDLFAKNRKLEIVYITGDYHYSKYNKTYPSIPEWLYLIDQADYVITNSFHGTVFSILFQKDFIVLPLRNLPERNIRMESLLTRLGLSERFIKNKNTGFFEFTQNIDWTGVSKKLENVKNHNSFINFMGIERM